MLGHEVGEALEVEVEHLDHDLRVALFRKTRIAANVAEQHGRAPALAPEPDPLVLGKADRRQSSTRDELLQLKALVEADDHVIHSASEVADLIFGGCAVDPLAKVALGDLDGDAAHLQDRAADGEGEQNGSGDRHTEPDQHPVAEALDHLPYGEIGVRPGLLDDNPQAETVWEGEGAEHDL